MEVAFLLGLMVMNGFFAMAEIGLIAARRGRLLRLVDQGDRRAAAALKLRDDANTFLSTIQVGITSIAVLSGIVGEAAFAEPLRAVLGRWGVPMPWAGWLATAAVVITITYLSIVIGELVPKRIGQLHAEAVARLVARPIRLLSVLGSPFVKLLSVSTESLLALLGQRGGKPEGVTEEEIHAMLAEGSEAGIIEREEHLLLRNIFRLDSRHLPSLMTPRPEIEYLDLSLPQQDNLERVISTAHSRFPVCDGGLDNLIGVAHAKQLLAQALSGRPIDLTAALQSPVFVPETLTGMGLLERFRSTGSQVMFVINEYGEVEGLITLQDVLDVVTGDLMSETLRDAEAIRREDGSWILDGLIPASELQEKLGLDSVPDDNERRYHTLSGMMLWLLGRMPKEGDVAVWSGWRFEVVEVEGRCIAKVVAAPIVNAEL